MPFIKKIDPKHPRTPADSKGLFIGRNNEIHFFVEHILKPEDPAHNIISIWGQGGIGKSTLLRRLMNEAQAPDAKDYCLTAFVDERQAALISILEKFAKQLHLTGEFEKAAGRYKEALRKLHAEREDARTAFGRKVSTELAGSLVKQVPVVGGLLEQSAELAAGYLWDEWRYRQLVKDAERLENPIADLTNAFVEELNTIAETPVILSADRTKRMRRVLLFFDTFEQSAPQLAPWLLDYFLEADISSNVVLVIAGRSPLEHSTPDDPKRWSPYLDQHMIYQMSLGSFTEEETRQYLSERGITDPIPMVTIWRLSRGLPLYLSLLTTAPQGVVDPTADVVANFLRWIPEQESSKRKLVLDAALFSRPFNQDELKALQYLARDERPSLFRWLTMQPFVRSNPQDGRFSYHELVQELFSRYLYQRSQDEYYATRRALTEYYRRLLNNKVKAEGKDAYESAQWLELTLALAHQLFLLADEGSHTKAIEQILTAHIYAGQTGEIVRLLRDLAQGSAHSQVNASIQQSARQLLEYIEEYSEGGPQEFLAAVNSLLEKVAHERSFSKELVASLYNQRGNAYRHLKQYQQALRDYSQAIALNPKVAVYYGNRGNAYRGLHKDYEEVVAGREPPDSIDADLYHRRGDAYRRLVEDYEQAIADYSQAITLEPTASGYHNRGIAHYMLERYEQAIADYSQAITLEPSAGLYHDRGHAHMALEQYEQAIADYSQAITLEPTASRYHNRGHAHSALKQYERALADYDRAVALNPKVAVYYGHRGNAYYHLGLYEQTIADFSQAITLDPSNVDLYDIRASAYRRLNEYDQALADHIHTLELAPGEDWPYASRGLTYLWLKDINQARADYTRGWELNPTNVYNGWMVEWLRMCQERADLETAGRLESIAAADPQHYTACVCRGVALWIREYVEEALAELELAISLGLEEWDVYFWEGMIRASLGQEDEAVRVLKKALALHLPPVLLSPLRWLEQRNLNYYEKHALPLLAEYGL